MVQAYLNKKSEKEALLRQRQAFQETNNEIAYLKNQIKMLSWYHLIFYLNLKEITFSFILS